MTELQASRTLVKSQPELWAECSDAASLARHLGGFGDIRITRLDPETAVAWEGERARGTVRIEPAGWGTKVILTAVAATADPPTSDPPAVADPPTADPPVVAEAVAAADPAPPAEPEPEPATEPPPRRRRFARLFARLRGPEPPPQEPLDPPEPEHTEPQPEHAELAHVELEPAPAVPDAEAALTAALDSLGQAHHRPFSRA
jgi:hypothetical protein